jgi:hypothetical protein
LRIFQTLDALNRFPALIRAFFLLFLFFPPLLTPGKTPACHASRFFPEPEEAQKKKPRYVAKNLFRHLPDELVCEILSYLPGNERVACGRVSRNFQKIGAHVLAFYPTECTVDGRKGVPSSGLVARLYGLNLHHTLKHPAFLKELAQQKGSLQTLTLGPRVTSAKKAYLLFRVITQNPELHTLDLTPERLDDRGVQMLAFAIRSSRNLKKVRLFCPKRSLALLENPEETDQVLEALQDSCPDLEKLTLEGMPFSCLRLERFSKLQELALVYQPDQATTDLFVPPPPGTGTLFAFRTLTLRNAGLGPQEARALSQIFRRSPALQHLDLAGNWLGDPALEEIVRSLPHTLSTLVLDDMDPGEMTASALLARMLSWQNLTSLSLNESYDFDPAPLLGAASVHPALRVLSLKGTQKWTEEALVGLQALVMAPPSALEQVMFSWKKLDPEQQAAMLKALEEARLPVITLPHTLHSDPKWKGPTKTACILAFLERNPHTRTLVLEGNFNTSQINTLVHSLGNAKREITLRYPDMGPIAVPSTGSVQVTH